MLRETQKYALGVAFLLLAFIPLWVWVVVPQMTKLPADFSYKADILSFDNFYDEQAEKFTGEKRSVSKFSYEVTGEKDGVLLIKNLFDVRKVTGEKIFAVERLYGVQALTGKHVTGFGDHDRQGSLFAPRHLKKGQPFTYWHINYDGPAHLQFVGEEDLLGLPVYRYETRYDGIRIEQTKNLETLPEVGVARGVELEPYLQVWIEPTTGYMVKYSDDTVAYYNDLKTGSRLHPWNHFRNSFTSESIQRHVELAKQERTKMLILESFLPAAFAFTVLLLVLFAFRKSRAAKILFVAVMWIAVLVAAGLWLSANKTVEKPYAGPMEKISIGAEKGLLTSPLWVAEHNGYFRTHGLEVDIKVFSSGRAAFMSLLQDENIDIATVAQTPIALRSFDRSDYAIIGGMVSSPNDVKILARKDRGIKTAQDLRGKKIGITTNTTGHYFLALFLAQHSLELQEVTLQEFDAAALSLAVRDGQVDAISTWEPHIYEAKTALGDNAVLLESSGTFREDFYFAVLKEWAKDHPELLQRFLKAIDEAEIFIANHPKESQSIIAKRLDLDPAFVESVWKDFTFGLFLDQAILLTLEQQARWMISNEITDKKMVPNYFDFLLFDPLEGVKPSAISIIR